MRFGKSDWVSVCNEKPAIELQVFLKENRRVGINKVVWVREGPKEREERVKEEGGKGERTTSMFLMSVPRSHSSRTAPVGRPSCQVGRGDIYMFSHHLNIMVFFTSL